VSNRRSTSTGTASPGFATIPVVGVGEITEGDDLAAVVLDALLAQGDRPADGDILVIASKVLSKAEGRQLEAIDREAAIDAETVRVVAERITARGSTEVTTRVVQSRSGPVLAAAGVDASNVAPGRVLLLPADPDASARALRHRLHELTGARIGVVVSDTAGRAWRDGQVDLAIGAAGVQVTDDLRGATDRYGNPLEVTVRAVVDELASAADLVKGKLGAVPAALVRGLPGLVTPDDGPGAAALLRGPASDWFRLGHVEAVRSALGVPPGTKGIPAAPMTAGSVTDRLRRALDVALAGPDLVPRTDGTGRMIGMGGTGEMEAWPVVNITADQPDGAVTARVEAAAPPADPADPADAMALAGFVQRAVTAAWAEDLRLHTTLLPDGSVLLRASVPPPA
jgi:coenzyme F420-0:L-glutamate ligase/coenzyme F420-1:gamma-L-glutamate ligase